MRNAKEDKKHLHEQAIPYPADFCSKYWNLVKILQRNRYNQPQSQQENSKMVVMRNKPIERNTNTRKRKQEINTHKKIFHASYAMATLPNHYADSDT